VSPSSQEFSCKQPPSLEWFCRICCNCGVWLVWFRQLLLWERRASVCEHTRTYVHVLVSACNLLRDGVVHRRESLCQHGKVVLDFCLFVLLVFQHAVDFLALLSQVLDTCVFICVCTRRRVVSSALLILRLSSTRHHCPVFVFVHAHSIGIAHPPPPPSGCAHECSRRCEVRTPDEFVVVVLQRGPLSRHGGRS